MARAAVAHTGRPGLLRSLKKWELAAVAANGVIGAGIFGLPSKAFALVGAYSVVAYVACAALVGLIVLCFAEVSSRFTGTGGPYLYAREAFGPAAGFGVGWLMWLARVTAFAANCNLLVDYLGYFSPAASAGGARYAVETAIMAAFLAINIRGIRNAALASNLLAACKLGGLGLFVVVGLFFVHWGRLVLGAPPAPAPFAMAVLLLVYTFTGFEMAAVPAGEAADPRASLPDALIVAVAACASLFVLVQAVCIGTTPALAASARPLTDAGRQFLGPAAGSLMAALAVFSIGGNLNAVLLSGARHPFAMAEHDDLPAPLAYTHRRFRTPHVSLIATALVMLVVTVTGTFVYAVTVSVVSRLVVYLATCAALPVLRMRRGAAPALFRVPGGWAVAAAGVAVIAWLLAETTWSEARDTAIAAGIGYGLYGWHRLRKKA